MHLAEGTSAEMSDNAFKVNTDDRAATKNKKKFLKSFKVLKAASAQLSQKRSNTQGS